MRNIISVIWASHLTAALAATLVFAVVDPADFMLDTAGSTEAIRVHSYALGFFSFWALALIGGLLTRYLDRPIVGALQ